MLYIKYTPPRNFFNKYAYKVNNQDMGKVKSTRDNTSVFLISSVKSKGGLRKENNMLKHKATEDLFFLVRMKRM